MQKILVSVRYGVEVEIPEKLGHGTAEEYAIIEAVDRVRNDEYIEPLAVEIIVDFTLSESPSARATAIARGCVGCAGLRGLVSEEPCHTCIRRDTGSEWTYSGWTAR
jgi:hypothetical protein